MTRRLALPALISAALLVVLLPRAAGLAPTPWVATPGADFSPLPASRPAASPTSTVPRDMSGLRAATSGPPLTGAPATAVPSRAAATPRGAIAGIASWYATGGSGDYAAAGPRLRSELEPGWRGSYVVVCGFSGGRSACATTVLGDFCFCRIGESQRLIDLSPSVFLAVCGPLSRGLCRVTVQVLQ